MLYAAYDACNDAMQPLRGLARANGGWLKRLAGNRSAGGPGKLAAACEMLAQTTLTHYRPAFGIPTTTVDGRTVAVREEVACTTPFGTLVRFVKESGSDVDKPQPRVLLIAPLSGHFATLLRGTVTTLLPEHDVYITDWHNARNVPLSDGPFGFDEYVEHIIKFLEAMGPGAHMVAVCQSCVQAVAAAALLAEDSSPLQPASMTLMAGPVDARVKPTKVNELAVSKPISWFERNLIATVPLRYLGARRRVYPGFVQLSAFMSMNVDRHIKSHIELYQSIADGDQERARVLKSFYDEYFAVLDLAAEFYLETVQRVFQEYHLALGKLEWRGRRVDPRAIRRTALLTVEGEKDDICAVGQTVAAHDLCSGLRPYLKRHHLQAGVGHYGVFSGKRWSSQIYPILRNTILASS
ncbi:MAG TPA: polyhydroxyalkanoate depolymerase [Burkholderiales bacterium]|nr:polyhydroxyalkanoate depolymerase [Burkholderiales bacterium]